MEPAEQNPVLAGVHTVAQGVPQQVGNQTLKELNVDVMTALGIVSQIDTTSGLPVEETTVARLRETLQNIQRKASNLMVGGPPSTENQLAKRAGRAGAPFRYKLWKLLEALKLASLLRDSNRMSQAVKAAMQYVSSEEDRVWVEEQLARESIPSPATLSRARLVADMLMCLWRQHHWESKGIINRKPFLFLTADSSPQGGRDWLLVEEDALCIDDVMVINNAEALQRLFEVNRALPPCVLGSGNTSVANKVHTILHQIKLEVGADSEKIQAYCDCVVGWCSDFGAEASVPDCPRVNMEKWLTDSVRESMLVSCEQDGTIVLPGCSAVEAAFSAGQQCARTTSCVGHHDDDNQGASASPTQSIKTAREPTVGNGDVDDLDGPRVHTKCVRSGHSLGRNTRLFQRALFVPGMKHLMDNLLKDLVRQLPHYKQEVEPHLKALETILSNKWYRDRLQHTCFAEENLGQLFRSWSSNLCSHRWESVAGFVQEVLTVEGPLRSFWNPRAFSLGKHSPEKGSALGGADDFVQKFDAAVSNAMVWAYMAMLQEVFQVVTFISSWAEGCSCHEEEHVESHSYFKRRKAIATNIDPTRVAKLATCVMKGRRAPELACGFLEDQLSKLRATKECGILKLALDLQAKDAELLQTDWRAARDYIIMGLTSKLAFWSNLPHKLAGMAHTDEGVARETARAAIYMWDQNQQTTSAQGAALEVHPLSEKLLADVPGSLRGDVLRFVHGEPWENLPLLAREVLPLRLLRVVERRIEGRHKVVSHVFHRAPAAGPSYVSMELRQEQMASLLRQRPNQECHGCETPWWGSCLAAVWEIPQPFGVGCVDVSSKWSTTVRRT